jgi:hypothetical protein
VLVDLIIRSGDGIDGDPDPLGFASGLGVLHLGKDVDFRALRD